MKYASLKYSLKVWLTSVVISPALFVMVLALEGKMDLSEMFHEGLLGFSFYFLMVAFSFIFSFVTWLAFLSVILVVKIYCKRHHFVKWLIFFSGMSLTAMSFLLVLGPHEIFHDEFGILMCANCACIGWGVWYYRLELKATEPKGASEQYC